MKVSFQVVPLDVLLSVLANDQELVARKITKLLMPSYFPSKVTLEEACKRCVTLVKRSPLAGARFCEFAFSEGAYIHALMELFKAFISLVLSPNELNADQIDALLIAAAHLCNNLVSEAFYRVSLKKDLSGEKLKQLFLTAASGSAQSSVCKIISTISPHSVDDLLELCMSLVTNCGGLSDNLELQSEVRSVHKMMMSCDWFEYMFEALTRLLQKTANVCSTKVGTSPKHDIPMKGRRKTKSSAKKSSKHGKKSSTSATSRFEEDYGIAAGIAWQIKDLLIAEDTREAMLGSGILEVAFSALKDISEVSILQCMQWDFMNTSPVLAYANLVLHLSVKNVTSNGNNNHGIKKKDCVNFASSSSEASDIHI